MDLEDLSWLGEGDFLLGWFVALERDLASLGEDGGDVVLVGDGRLLGEDLFVGLCPLWMEDVFLLG